MKNTVLCLLLSLIYNVICAQKPAELSYKQLDTLIEQTLYEANIDEALVYINEGLERSRRQYGEQDSLYAKYTDDLGTFYEMKEDYTKAEGYYLRAARIFMQTHGISDRKMIGSYNNLGLLYDELGEYEKAESYFLQAKDILVAAKAEHHPSFAAILNNLSNLYIVMGQPEKAEPLFLQVISIDKAIMGKESFEYAQSLNNLATFYHKSGKSEKAAQCFLEVTAIITKILGKDHPDITHALNNLAVVYISMKRYDEAEALLLQTKNIRAKAYGEMSTGVANTCVHLGSIYKKTKQYVKAELYYKKALEIRAEILGNKNPTYAAALNGLAEVYLQWQKLDTALFYCKEAMFANAIDTQTQQHPLNNLAAFKYYSDEHINTSIDIFLEISEAQYQQSKDKKLLEFRYQFLQNALQLNERIRQNFNSEESKLQNLVHNNTLVLNAIETGMALGLPNFENDIFSLAEKSKGVLLNDAAKTERAYKFGDLPDSLVAKEKALDQQYHLLKAELLEKRPENEKDSLRSLFIGTEQKMDAFNKMLKKDFPKYSAIKYESTNIGTADIQALLDNKTALLEYVMSDSILYVFYLDKRQVFVHSLPIAIDSLKQNIKKLHRCLSRYADISTNPDEAFTNYTQIAHWFYQHIVKNALSKSQGIEQLIIIPDGELSYLPFEVFLSQPVASQVGYKDLPYLMKDYAIYYNYSAALWKENLTASRNSNNGQMLGIAADYEADVKTARLPVYRDLRSMLAPLPAAQKEVESLAENFAGHFAFGLSASEKTFKEKAKDYGIIHLAMHGLLDKKTPILSALAFSEDGDSTENNFLQAYEISQMQLNADLVVLSACQTGYGRFEKGNGTASLARAFMYAGVPALVVSLWEVNDVSTSAIMQAFYQHLNSGLTKDQALRQAKIDYIQNAKGASAHPAYWSAFVQIGDNRPMLVSGNRGNWWIWALGGGLLLVLITGLWWRKR